MYEEQSFCHYRSIFSMGHLSGQDYLVERLKNPIPSSLSGLEYLKQGVERANIVFHNDPNTTRPRRQVQGGYEFSTELVRAKE